MKLTRLVPADATDEAVAAARRELEAEAAEKGGASDALWAHYLTREDGAVEVTVADEDRPWDLP